MIANNNLHTLLMAELRQLRGAVDKLDREIVTELAPFINSLEGKIRRIKTEDTGQKTFGGRPVQSRGEELAAAFVGKVKPRTKTQAVRSS